MTPEEQSAAMLHELRWINVKLSTLQYICAFGFATVVLVVVFT